MQSKSYTAFTAPGIDQNVDYTSGAYYKILARQAIESRPDNFDFTTFRSYYTLTEQYDPLGENARNKMLQYAYAARHDPDPDKRNKAMIDYADLLAAHLANIDIIMQARALSETDRAFGDPEFFDWMKRGLMQDVMNSGDGTSLNGAYDIMTLGEESLLMNYLGLKVIKSEAAEENGVYYTMDEVLDPETAQPYWIFVDTSRPMKFLENQQKLLDTVISIPRQ